MQESSIFPHLPHSIFHIVLFQKKKKRKKRHSSMVCNVGGHPMESVSHGLRKEKRWGGVPSFIKEHKSANLSQKLDHFCMEDSKNPIASR
jgi:hypothetical protein